VDGVPLNRELLMARESVKAPFVKA
jgi:hypothetical protein